MSSSGDELPDEERTLRSSIALDEILIFGTPETRRRFLKQVAGTSAALAIGPTLLNIPSLDAAEPIPTSRKTLSDKSVHVNLKINGKDYVLEVDPRTTLLDALR